MDVPNPFGDNCCTGGGVVPSVGDVSVLQAELDALQAALDAEVIARIACCGSNSTAISQISIDGASITASITTERNLRISGDSALAQLITTLTAAVNGNTASIATNATVAANASSALASLITSLTATVNGNTAAISSIQTAYANADSALAQQITTLSATVGQNTAGISTESTARANAITALAQQITAINAAVASASARITSEATTRATQDTANATAITALSATVGSSNATVSNSLAAYAGRLGVVEGEYFLKVDINGRISGLHLIGDPTGTTFDMLADRVRIITPGQTPAIPFEVTADGLKVNNAVIDGKLMAAKFESTTLLYHHDYPLNFFPSNAIISQPFGNPVTLGNHDGTGEFNTFGDYNGNPFTGIAIRANVFSLALFNGVGVGTGYDPYRLGKPGMNRVLVQICAQAKKYVSVWYRIPEISSMWRIYAAFGWLAPGADDWRVMNGIAYHDISVLAGQHLEIGFNALDGGGNVYGSVEADNNIYIPQTVAQVFNY